MTTVLTPPTPGPPGPVGPQGPPGPTGPPGGGAGSVYLHTQNTASTFWDIVHNLGYYPNVEVIDSGGTTVEGTVQYLSADHITITFSVPFGGTATLT